MRDLVYLFEYILLLFSFVGIIQVFLGMFESGDVRFSWVGVFSFCQLFQMFSLFSDCR